MSVEEYKIPVVEKPKSEYLELIKNKEADGWVLLGEEHLTKTKFSDKGSFEEIPFQTEDEIKARYLEELKQRDPDNEYEIDLVLNEMSQKIEGFKRTSTEEQYREILKNLNDEDKSFGVYVKKIEK